MSMKSKILGPAAVIGFLLTIAPVAIHVFERRVNVDTDAMLDVSVSIKTLSHVRIDKIGDSVWEMGAGSGVLVSSSECEVWTNEHVIAGAAVIEVFPRQWELGLEIPWPAAAYRGRGTRHERSWARWMLQTGMLRVRPSTIAAPGLPSITH